MAFRLIAILLVAAVIVSIFFADPIYNWFKNLFKSEKSDEDENEKGEK